MKKTILSLFTALSVFTLAACGNDKTSEETTTEKETTPIKESVTYDKDVASISIFLTGNLQALEITPVGTTTSDFLPLQEERFPETEYLGFTKEPDMEALIALQPDEIFIDAEFAEKHGLDKYEAIATTHVINLDEGRWKDHLNNIAEITDRTETAEQFIADYEAKVEEVKVLAKDKLGEGTVMAVRVSAKGIRVYGMERPLGPILFEDLGFTPAPGIEAIDKNWENISKEVLPDYNPDTMFVLVSSVDEGSQQVFDELQNDPIWQSLKAVQNNQVIVIEENPWLDYSAYGNKLALENLEEILLAK
ncbi:ABC transporter substrate-binding protein [Lysinibacillus xylanilyticus]|uniref:ABC transporter substrate-binding protein n=1 Tax=Lysinibacillus xylanilyticus TaxID=582475 RepID=A0ABV3VXT7_9BACI